VACGDAAKPAATAAPAAPARPAAAPTGPRADCSTQSGADFSRAFTAPENLVVGPLVLIGGAYTPPAVVRRFGGQKFPLLVMAGHTVTITLPVAVRAFAGLAYGPLPEGPTRLRDAHRAVTFVACSSDRTISTADGAAVTFWSGAVLTRRPACLPLEIAIDGGEPQRVGLALGRRC
jgi:hypothetical protein